MLNSPQDIPKDQIQNMTLEEIAYATNEIQDVANLYQQQPGDMLDCKDRA